MAGLSKQHFNAIAEIINECGSKNNQILIYNSESDFLNRLADYFATQNPLFNKERFLKACLK